MGAKAAEKAAENGTDDASKSPKTLTSEEEATKKAKDLKCERISTVWIGVMLVLLALSAMASSVYRLAKHEKPETAIPGMVVALLSLSFMFFLWRYKLKAARILDSKTLESDAQCSLGCIQLSVTLFLGSLLQILGEEVFHTDALWWVDAAGGIVIALFILHDGYSCIKNATSKSFDGNCGCCQEELKETEKEPELAEKKADHCCSGEKEEHKCGKENKDASPIENRV